MAMELIKIKSGSLEIDESSRPSQLDDLPAVSSAIHELTAQVSRISHTAQHKRSGIDSLVSDCSCSRSKVVPGLSILLPKSNTTSLVCVN